MRNRNPHTRRLFITAAITGMAVFGSPSAGASEAVSQPAPVSAWVNQVSEQLRGIGVATPPVNPAMIASADAAVARIQADADAFNANVHAAGAQAQAALHQIVRPQQPQAVHPAPAPLENTQPTQKDAQGRTIPEVVKREKAFEPIIDGPNYHWRTDLLSQFMAQHPGKVLNRVAGSWFNSPDVPAESLAAEKRGISLYGPGTPVYVGKNSLCTVAATGHDSAGRAVAITAGHCGAVGQSVESADSWRIGPSGTVALRGDRLDYSVIELGSNAEVTNAYNGIRVNSVGGHNPNTGETACKQGIATGHSCGHIWNKDALTSMSQICARQGDSGAPVIVGDRVVGIVKRGAINNQALACHTPWQGPLFMPTISTNMDAVLADINAKKGVGAGFTLAK
ncbi:S1 family peptidase [Corynebacterium pseudotuberculosis]|uniref:Secreted protein n=1 Tax=Corynebacterium pseudotuberculosis 258 TaxID=1168865 RepID=A0AAU8Q5G5_CORPS|nr:S1 family peptidase [Corynebacterium pseudotuberculosis]AER68645.1 Hypothetical protein Cp106_0556 [Corynebacterium pseudotuberculosis 1/06-A]AEQ06130.2 hypothetical protein CPCIP5297_03005 [Corynebacterium pseudotuberculosis CIP 52.97]AFB71906.1 hypothetical protein CP316_02990 [Corynebacterium pseudotuberculosis 316]AFH90404.1 hypothetical protein CP31_03220 [Corynebacterium pseudotuberculosis 31]AFK16217.1 hypothetical protein CP258_03005 [Corynebacterium pseudotuberculosis 258]